MNEMEPLLSRKFLFAVVFCLLGFVLVVLGKTTTEVFFSFVQFIGSTYIIGNVADKVTDKIKQI